jgi:serine/threonine protein kinase/sugar lactone lactonase YvrE
MTDGPQRHGWWQASDLKWYPPEQRPDAAALPPPPAADAAQQQPADSTLAATPAPQQPRKPAKTRQVIERDRLGLLTKIGQGGQGVVYRAPNVKTKFASSMVYKEYKPQTRTEIDFTALAAMPALVEQSLSYAQAERLVSVAAWPCALVEEAGTPTGFVMPAIPQEFFIALATVKGVSSSSAEFQHLLNHSSVLAARGINIDDAQRYTLLRETASALAFLHKHGVCVGDISPKNLLFSLTPQEAIYFIDCDAMRINTVSALPQVETPGWNAPAGEELATIYTDTYKLGLLALRLLTGDHDTTNPGHLPAKTPALLRQIITDTLTNQPHQRPLPEAWTYVLGHAIEQAQHQKKTTPPVSAPQAPPPTPIVHSRPPVHSAPPVRPSAPPVPPPRPAERPPVPQPRRAEWPPTEIATLPRRPWWRRQAIVIPAALLTVAVIAAAIVITSQHQKHEPVPAYSAQITLPTGTQHREPAYGPQVTLPYSVNGAAEGVAVDSAGNLYVTDGGYGRVLKLAAGSSTPTVLPFTGLGEPDGVAVDTAGDLYVADYQRVLKLPAGSATQTVLPFTDLKNAVGVAVDTAGDLYVTDYGNNRVLKLPAGSSSQTVLPFTGLNGPTGVAVDTAGDLYVADNGNNRVLKLPAGSDTQSVLPFTGLSRPDGVAVDTASTVYVADSSNNRVLELAAGSATPSVLPFTGLGIDSYPQGVAVDTPGNVYLVNDNNNRVLKLPVG